MKIPKSQLQPSSTSGGSLALFTRNIRINQQQPPPLWILLHQWLSLLSGLRRQKISKSVVDQPRPAAPANPLKRTKPPVCLILERMQSPFSFSSLKSEGFFNPSSTHTPRGRNRRRCDFSSSVPTKLEGFLSIILLSFLRYFQLRFWRFSFIEAGSSGFPL